MSVQAVPEGYHTVTPYLIVSDAAAALAFYTQVFGGVELFRMPSPGGRVGHAEIQVGSSRLMLADEHPEVGALSAKTVGGSPVGMMLYVEDCDAVYGRAVAAGAKVERELKNQFYGDRSGTVRDPFGLQWTISTHVEDVTPEEMERRNREASEG